MFNFNNKGFSVFELMLAMTAGAFFTYLAFSGYNMWQRQSRVMQQSDMFYYIKTTADSVTAGRSDFRIPSGNSGIDLTDNSFSSFRGTNIPTGFSLNASGAYEGPFGTVALATESSAGTASDLLSMSVSGVDQKSCMALLANMAPVAYDMYVNNSLIGMSPAPTADSLGRSEINVAHAGQLCANNSTVKIRILKEVNFNILRHSGHGTFTPAEANIIVPLYTRMETAMTARENAQSALGL